MHAKKLLLLFLFISLSFSQFFGLELVKNYVLPATIILVSAALGISWMLSDMFANPQLKAWVKLEIRSLLSAGILMILVYSLFFGTNTLASILTGEPNVNTAAIERLNTFIDVLVPSYNDLIYASHYVGMISGFGYTAPTFLWVASINFVSSPHSGMSAIQSMVVQGAGAISQAFIIYYTIQVLLDFFANVVPPVILPLAISLRFIPFTKKLGNSLIALCIGAALIFPAAVLITGYFHELALKDVAAPRLDFGPFKEFSYPFIGWFCESSYEDAGDSIVSIAKDFTSISEIGWGIIVGLICCLAASVGCAAAFTLCYNYVTQVLFPAINLIYQGLFWLIALIDYNSFFGSLDVNAIYQALGDFLELVIYHVLMAYLDVVLIAILTVVTTKSISSAIGGEAYLTGIQRLI